MDSIQFEVKKALIKIGIPITNEHIIWENNIGYFPSIRIYEIDQAFNSITNKFKNFTWKYRVPTNDYFFTLNN